MDLDSRWAQHLYVAEKRLYKIPGGGADEAMYEIGLEHFTIRPLKEGMSALGNCSRTDM